MSSSARLAWTLTFCTAVALAGAGCGSSEETAVPRTPTTGTVAAKLRDCQTVGRDSRGAIVLCQERGPNNHGMFVVDDGGRRQLLAVRPPGPTETASDAGRVGHWAWAVLSPDGSTLLGQWSAECEVPIAFFIPAADGDARVVSGEDDWATSPTSVALGWTTDGRAIVLFPKEAPCGVPGRAGLYLIGTDGTRTRIRGIDSFVTNLQPSLRPRSAASLKER